MSNVNAAFVFPGQGSQKVGMLDAAFREFQSVRDTFEEASEALGYDAWKLIQTGPQEALNLTKTTQPVLLSSRVALWRAWQEQSGQQPTVLAGHSLGEFTALVCAQVIAFSDAVKLVEKRGEFMQSAVPVGEGAMAAILGLDDATINALCDEVSTQNRAVVAAVNYNSPGQVVIAGHATAVQKASEQMLEAGAKRAMALPVSAPFHTTLMQPAGENLADVMAGLTFSSPVIPVIHNVNAQTENDPEEIKALLVKQIASPVQWTACIGSMCAGGVTHIVECGPGKVLSGLNRRIDKALASYSIEEPAALNAAVLELR